mmetsp:Transcript_106940/g.276585  ORF Transcript_106940/g.276585 Transcript_106940/m.276585 type:complete len:374 (-) Transcript_106940:7-1128(-)
MSVDGSRDAIPWVTPTISSSGNGAACSGACTSARKFVAQDAKPEHSMRQLGFGHATLWHFQEHCGFAQTLRQSSPHCVVQTGGLQTVLHFGQSSPPRSQPRCTSGQMTAHCGAPQRVSQVSGLRPHSVLHSGGAQKGSQTWLQTGLGPQCQPQCGLHSPSFSSCSFFMAAPTGVTVPVGTGRARRLSVSFSAISTAMSPAFATTLPTSIARSLTQEAVRTACLMIFTAQGTWWAKDRDSGPGAPCTTPRGRDCCFCLIPGGGSDLGNSGAASAGAGAGAATKVMLSSPVSAPPPSSKKPASGGPAAEWRRPTLPPPRCRKVLEETSGKARISAKKRINQPEKGTNGPCRVGLRPPHCSKGVGEVRAPLAHRVA